MWFSMDASDEVDSIGPADAGQEDYCVYDLDWTCCQEVRVAPPHSEEMGL